MKCSPIKGSHSISLSDVAVALSLNEVLPDKGEPSDHVPVAEQDGLASMKCSPIKGAIGARPGSWLQDSRLNEVLPD